jgi:hypothetical protein
MAGHLRIDDGALLLISELHQVDDDETLLV